MPLMMVRFSGVCPGCAYTLPARTNADASQCDVARRAVTTAAETTAAARATSTTVRRALTGLPRRTRRPARVGCGQRDRRPVGRRQHDQLIDRSLLERGGGQ